MDFSAILSQAPAGTKSLTTESYRESCLRAANAKTGTLTDYDCPICGNHGYELICVNGKFMARECKCMVERRNRKRIRLSGLSELLSRYTFDAYQADEDWQKVALRKAKEYVESPNGWFVIVGNAGTGKTHLCTAICGELMQRGKDVMYMLWREDAPRLKGLVNDRDEYDRLMNQYKACDVLYIDDFLKGSVTDADVNLSFELLNARYNDRRKRTIISGEKTIEQILNIDEAIGSRIYECSAGFRVKTVGQNRRLK